MTNSLKRDANDMPVLGAVTDDAFQNIVNLLVDPVTGRLLVSAVISGLGTPVAEEAPTDSGDQTNFTLAHTPLANTFRLYRAGARQTSLVAISNPVDFTLTGNVVTLTTSLASGEALLADYQY